jgi:peptidoglycan/LPS O-acetylase OafA/YrhL
MGRQCATRGQVPPAGAGVRPTFGSRLSGIEGLRALAAGSIVVYHTWLYAPPGSGSALLGRRLDMLMPNLAFGVALFFTLSGFLLYRPFAASIIRDDRLPDVRRYLRNRALRILPAYWMILVLCAVVLGSMLYRDPMGGLANGRVLDPWLVSTTALFVQNFDPGTVGSGIGPAWSLAVEVVFYLTLPFIALLGVALARRRSTRRGRCLAALAPAALVLCVGLTGKAAAAYLVPPPAPYDGWGANWHSVVERSFWGHADLFTFGMALAVARVNSEDGLLRLPRWWRRAAAAGFLGVSVFVALYGEGQLSYSLHNTVAAAACALLLALVVLPPAGIRRSPLVRVLEWRPLVAAGVVSYSIFLWHEPLIRWLDDRGLTLAGRSGFVVNLALVGVVTGVAATLTYRFVEAPALRAKLARRGRLASPAVAAPEVLGPALRRASSDGPASRAPLAPPKTP